MPEILFRIESSMASSSKKSLAVHILQEFYGDCVADVGECLIRKGSASVREILVGTKLTVAKVRVLCV
jgi:hypothetical protein